MSDEGSITCVEAVSLLKLIDRVEESADPNASRELARRNRLALQQPERRVSAAFGLFAKAIRARDDALRSLAQEQRRDEPRRKREANGEGRIRDLERDPADRNDADG